MGLILQSIDDPRDRLTKARKMELVRYAQANGLKHVSDAMPAILIQSELRKRGLTNPQIANRVLGSPEPRFGGDAIVPPDAQGVEADAEADLMRQWMAQQGTVETVDPVEAKEAEAPPVVLESKPPNVQRIAWLRKQCKERGIKIVRTDTVRTMEHKLGIAGAMVNGENAA